MPTRTTWAEKAIAAATVAVATATLALVAAPPSVLGAGWSHPRRVTQDASLSSLHEVAATHDVVVVVRASIGPRPRDDRLILHRSVNGGATWPIARSLFASGDVHRTLVPNLAVAARGDLVAVVFRTRGPAGTALFMRVSRDRGLTFAPRRQLAGTTLPRGLGVPSVAISEDAVVVAWTDRRAGDIRIRRSTDGARQFGDPRTLARTRLSIACGDPNVLDGLVGLVATTHTVHLAWSDAQPGECVAGRVLSRTSGDDGLTWHPPRLVTTATTFGWAELAARGARVLATIQAPDGSLVISRSVDRGRHWSTRRFTPTGDRELGAGDVVLRDDGSAWIAYPDLAYSGGHVATSRLRIRHSTDSGRTWEPPVTLLPDAPRLRQVPDLALRHGLPVLVYQSGPTDESRSDIWSMRRT